MTSGPTVSIHMKGPPRKGGKPTPKTAPMSPSRGEALHAVDAEPSVLRPGRSAGGLADPLAPLSMWESLRAEFRQAGEVAQQAQTHV